MTATAVDLPRVLMRAWDRAVRDPADKLDPELARQLADAAESALGRVAPPEVDRGDVVDRAEHDQVRVERDETVAALVRARDDLHAAERLVEDRTRDLIRVVEAAHHPDRWDGDLSTAAVLAVDAIDALAVSLEAARTTVAGDEHRHTYPWPDLSGPIQSCECGKPYPRTQTRGLPR